MLIIWLYRQGRNCNMIIQEIFNTLCWLMLMKTSSQDIWKKNKTIMIYWDVHKKKNKVVLIVDWVILTKWKRSEEIEKGRSMNCSLQSQNVRNSRKMSCGKEWFLLAKNLNLNPKRIDLCLASTLSRNPKSHWIITMTPLHINKNRHPIKRKIQPIAWVSTSPLKDKPQKTAV